MAGTEGLMKPGLFALILFAHWTETALAAHPLLTEDTGTQGTGHVQLELTHDLSHAKDAASDTRARRINAVLSVGLAENLDVIIGVVETHGRKETAILSTFSTKGTT